MDMMEGGVEVKRLILARSRLPPEEVSGRVVSGRSSALLLLVIYNIFISCIIFGEFQRKYFSRILNMNLQCG